MSNFDNVQRRLDSQYSRAHYAVSDLAKDRAKQDGAPGVEDMYEFQNALMQESTAKYVSGQLTSLKHSLSKSIIDSIN